MADSTCSNLLLRIRPSGPDTPLVFPVEATLDGTGSLLASIEISAELLSHEANPWEYGRRLGECLFADANLRRFLAYARGPAGNRVSLTLQIDPEALAAHDLLWERLIYSYGQEEEALAASSRFAFSRIIPSEDPTTSPVGEGPFRLLLVIATPLELEESAGALKAIDIAAEVKSLRTAWDPLVQRGLLRVTVLARVDEETKTALQAAGYRVAQIPATLNSISDALSSFDSLHLICHGAFKKGRASLLLEDPEGRSALVAEDEFLPKLGTRSLRLVFLQACQSARREPGVSNVFSGLAPKIARRAAAVIAMQDFVRIDDAARFAQEFYETLLSTGSASRAASAGRLTLRRPDSGNWAIPALYLAPNAEPLWQPDAILAASQDMASRFRDQHNPAMHFPIEVIRHIPGESSKMETSPPGPRVPVFEAVEAALLANRDQRSGVVVLAGNSGRAKTSQLYDLYTRYAAQVSAGGPIPLFARIGDFDLSDLPAAQAVARAVAKTYLKEAELVLSTQLLAKRLSQSFILFLDADQDTYSRKRAYAFQTTAELVEGRTDASVVVTLDEQSIADAALLNPEGSGSPPMTILLVQLLCRSAVSQYLGSIPGEIGKTLLKAVESSNLFDIASVPWLLTSLIRQSHRAILSRSGVIARVVNGNLLDVNWAPGTRRIVSDFLGLIAWTLQTHQRRWLSGNLLYDVLDEVRGKREISLDSVRALALETKIVGPSEDDGLRFAYPGFQSYWCAQYLIEQGPAIGHHLDNITATLGRRSRVKLWEDTLVLLSGMIDSPDSLVRRILAGSSLSHGDQIFLAVTCIHEARLSGKAIAPDVTSQVLDNLVWRSSSSKERRSATRIRAVECLGLLHDDRSIPHLLSLVLHPVRTAGDGTLAFELSGLRQVAVEVLLTMQTKAEQLIHCMLGGADQCPGVESLLALIDAWRGGDSATLQQIFLRKDPGIPAIVAFALASLGGEPNLDFLIEQILVPELPDDTMWAIADALLHFNPADVSRRAIGRIQAKQELHPTAAYIIGKLQVAIPGDENFAFLNGCLKSAKTGTRARALRALAEVGESRCRPLCECLATAQWERAEAEWGFPPPVAIHQMATLRYYALESLRLIGTMDSINILREARLVTPSGVPDDPRYGDFIELSYEVSEDIYWRVTGGMEGDSYNPPPTTKPN